MTVMDIATTGIETAGQTATAEALAITMEEKNVGSVVIEDGMEPVGIVTDRDLAVRVLAEKRDPAAVRAEDIMSVNPATVAADAGVFELTNAMAEASVRRIPVVDGDELAGIVTLDDVMALLVAELGNLGGVIEAEALNY